MRDAIAAFLGALGGGAFSFIIVLIYIAVVSRVARKVFQSVSGIGERTNRFNVPLKV
jgi:hypothetical protein